MSNRVREFLGEAIVGLIFGWWCWTLLIEYLTTWN